MSEPLTTRSEARDGIRSALLAWEADGVPNPCMPMYGDTDGDGLPDFYALDSFGQVVIIDEPEELAQHTRVDLLDKPIEGVGP